MDLSEYSARPKRILLHHPRHGRSLELLTHDQLRDINFFELPDTQTFYSQYDRLALALSDHVETVYLNDLIADDPAFQAEAAHNPNLIFTRDSSITLPWAPDLFIPARLSLRSRAGEAGIITKAMARLGVKPALLFVDDEFIEGGDVLPATDEGKRILLIGFGVRTTKAAALRLALELIPKHLDQIIGLSHDPDLLHLDTGFTILPNRVIFAAAGMFSSGFLIDENRSIRSINPIKRAEDLGFTIVRCDKADAIAHERCNLLPLGQGQYLAFSMPGDLKAELEQAAHIAITSIHGGEIAKAAGGVHCLTRPIYI